MKKGKKALVVVGLTLGVTTSAFAATALLNWNGTQVVSETKEYISASANKIIAQEKLVVKLKGEVQTLKDKITQLESGSGNGGTSGGTGSSDEIRNLQQQIIEKNNEITRLENEIISKQNDIDHLTRELQRANDEITEQKTALSEAKDKLADAGINLYYTEE